MEISEILFSVNLSAVIKVKFFPEVVQSTLSFSIMSIIQFKLFCLTRASQPDGNLIRAFSRVMHLVYKYLVFVKLEGKSQKNLEDVTYFWNVKHH